MLTDIPAIPLEPGWDHINSRYAIPPAIIGVEYKNADTGAALSQGTTIDVPTPLPQMVHVTTDALPGYTMSAPGDFSRYFYDPTTVSILASDGFSGAANININGRAADMALGGSLSPAPAWDVTNTAFAAATLGIDGSGHLVPSKESAASWADAANFLRVLYAGQKALRVEIDVTQFSSGAGIVAIPGYSRRDEVERGSTPPHGHPNCANARAAHPSGRCGLGPS
jgi:hypothetical protein